MDFKVGDVARVKSGKNKGKRAKIMRVNQVSYKVNIEGTPAAEGKNVSKHMLVDLDYCPYKQYNHTVDVKSVFDPDMVKDKKYFLNVSVLAKHAKEMGITLYELMRLAGGESDSSDDDDNGKKGKGKQDKDNKTK